MVPRSRRFATPAGTIVRALLAPACAACRSPLEQPLGSPVCVACWRSVRSIAPPICVRCGDALVSWRAPGPLCARCRRRPPDIDLARSAGRYEGALRELIHLFKYGGVRTLAKPFGGHLAVALPRNEKFDAVVPMPLHWLRRWHRGFNQSDLLAREVARRCGVPVTSHVSIGSDITHAHANCDGAALGAASYTDFLIFARSVQDLEGGVYLNIGSAVTGPEVYLKALSMARNVAHQRGKKICRFTTAVFDLMPLPEDYRDHVRIFFGGE